MQGAAFLELVVKGGIIGTKVGLCHEVGSRVFGLSSLQNTGVAVLCGAAGAWLLI
jgi:hypothetical protein